MAKRYMVNLDAEERDQHRALTLKVKAAARTVRRAQTLLLADEGRTDADIAAALHSGLATVARTRHRYVEEGLAAALVDHPRPGAAPKLSPKQQAFTVALACTKPPEGRLRWTMQLLAERLVELEVIPDISDESIRRLLKKTNSSPGSKRSG
jgi:transposase